MPALHLHIGQWKTGSSWIQASLRLSREALEAEGVSYPPRDEREGAGVAAITSGNGSGLLQGETALARGLAEHRPPAGRDLLFSSELMQKELREAPDLAFLPRAARAAGFSRVRILLFVRDPVSHAASGVQQRVKRHGATDIAALFEEHEGPLRAAELLDRLEALPDVETRVRNYSACSETLLEEVEDWLGLPRGRLVRPEVERINRSLTWGEFELLRALNGVSPEATPRLATALCERLPGIASDAILPPLAVQEALLARLAPAMARVDARLPEAHRHRRDLRAPSADPEVLPFSAAQLAIIAEELGRLDALLRSHRRDPAAHFGARTLLRALLRRLGRGAAARLGRGR